MPEYRERVKAVITPKFGTSFDEEAVTAEQLVARAGRNGFRRLEWVKTRERNEAQRQPGAPFELLEHSRETHHTPGGAVQQFVAAHGTRGKPL